MHGGRRKAVRDRLALQGGTGDAKTRGFHTQLDEGPGVETVSSALKVDS